MIQLIIIAIIGTVMAYFIGVSDSFEISKKLLDICIMLGILIVLLSPIFNIGKLLYTIFHKIFGISRRKSVRR